jgi:hypothetical protein
VVKYRCPRRVGMTVAGLGIAVLAFAGCSSAPSADRTTATRITITTGTTAWPHHCIDGGSSSILVPHLQSPPLCIDVGTHLTLAFDKKGQGVIPGLWTIPPVSTSNPSVLSVGRVTASGQTLTVGLDALEAGSASLRASFGQECSPSDAPPCTIPPQTWFTVNVTVAAAS